MRQVLKTIFIEISWSQARIMSLSIMREKTDEQVLKSKD